jgi:cytochrome c
LRTIRRAATGFLSLGFMLALHAGHSLSWAATARQAAEQPAKTEREEVEKLIQGSDCRSCHDMDRKVVGPSYQDIAKKYAADTGAVDKLMRTVRQGGSGNWGTIPMTPHPDLKDEDLKRMVTWILSLKSDSAASDTPKAKGKEYTYTLKDGKTVKLEYPLFVEGSTEKVTKDVFRGYELFNSYCFRCHGQDVTESELAPDLKRSIESGLTPQDFVATTMAGRDAKGMPSWAGFLTEEEVRKILMYVQGRTLDLIPVGRPPSEAE